jgi:hypothetical protein
MFRKSIILALAATVSLGATALSSSSASAFGFHGGRSVGGGNAVHFNGGSARFLGAGGLHVSRPMVNGIKINPGLKFGHHWNWNHRWWWRFGWRRPYWIAPVIATGGVATYAATTTGPATSTCTCLTKQYTPQGAVVFKDVCTNEMAMNPPASASPAADAGPQPYQQGYLQAPPQGQ